MRCAVYCITSSYNLAILFDFLRDHYTTELYQEVIYIKDPNKKKYAEACFFSYGIAVFWNWTIEAESQFLFSLPSEKLHKPPLTAMNTYEFDYAPENKFYRDKLFIQNNDALTKIAVSFGLSQSIKLEIFENMISQTIENSKQFPLDLASSGKIFLSRKELSKKIGQLFIDKALVNFHSDILDEPDFFWEQPNYHVVYQSIAKSLSIQQRTDVLNHRLSMLGDLLEILNDRLNHQHAAALEWTIIWLIVIEVTLTILKDLFHLF
ncbi:RMD1 family protein [Candidatus Clavichlamydia salmonicola]|uniref:RMD1 family protein n=1 Tax=Candidatus Clavichlamydia salmonicola TaxID=469812 RepID=UPI001891977F|nr:RMD1 family protein [Candidatus Clavichlamydia salmonicola]